MNYCEHVIRIELDKYPTFKLENAVCNHGFFMMAPNLWNPYTKCFSRPLRLSDSTTSVNVTISQVSHYKCLHVKVHHLKRLSSKDELAILAQVGRMLRLSLKDERDVEEFQKMHPEAKERGFGRIFRSPSLFEDAIKCILLCYCNFKQSLEMAQLLCEIQYQLRNDQISEEHLKRKRNAKTLKKTKLRNFPSSEELIYLDEDFLKKHAKTGLRTSHILDFAKKVESGEYDLQEFEKYNYTILCRKVGKINGFGEYAAANMKMCLGFYKTVPIDSETKRHLREVHERNDCSDSKTVKTYIQEIYGKYETFQCLAFWFELLTYYESRVGKLGELPSSEYSRVTGSLMQAKQQEAA